MLCMVNTTSVDLWEARIRASMLLVIGLLTPLARFVVKLVCFDLLCVLCFVQHARTETDNFLHFAGYQNTAGRVSVVGRCNVSVLNIYSWPGVHEGREGVYSARPMSVESDNPFPFWQGAGRCRNVSSCKTGPPPQGGIRELEDGELWCDTSVNANGEHMHVYMHVCMHYTHTHTHAHTHMYIYIYMCVCACVRVCV